MLRKILLVCGILSSLLYVGIDALAALRYGNYHSYTSQAISELSAVGAPTKDLVDPLFTGYNLLLLAFAIGVWASAGQKRSLRVMGALLLGIVVVGLVTPPMNLRGAGQVSGDLPHIVLTGVIVLFILAAVVVGVPLHGRNWRIYSFTTLVTLIASGAWTSLEASHLSVGQPTPWLGVAERINIGAYLLWVALLAITLLWRTKPSEPTRSVAGIRAPAVPAGA